ncbi:MAG TPA: rRNA maturation RNase YbeY [Candidatus Eisenbacteria bacterium]|nr:rRNA maturation RNase YbeY [Candidatus Eisenbacteria bacterium]
MPISAKSRADLPGVTVPLAALVRAALALEGRRPGELGIVLTGDAPVRELNRRWRGLDRATDVLSFGYDETPGEIVNGDLIVSMDRVIVQAKRFRVTPGRELARLIVHGALHLAGLDHRTAAERENMRARETRLLEAGAAHVRALEKALGGNSKPRVSRRAPAAASPRRRRRAGR